MRVPAALLVALLSTSFAARADKPLLERAAERLVGLGVHPRLAQRAARHIPLGMPSNPSRADDQDFLVVRTGYVLSYNGARNAPNWVSWNLRASDMDPNFERTKAPFRGDPTLPDDRFALVDSSDFRLAGYSRGHLVGSGDRSASLRENSKTFVLDQVIIQSINNNTGPWNGFELYCRLLARQGWNVQHIAGGNDWEHPPVVGRKVAVPGDTWRTAILQPPGNNLDEIDEHTRVITLSVPNDNERVKVEHPWEQFRTSLAELEHQRATTLPFLDHLPAHVQASLRKRVDSEIIPPPPQRRFTPRNYGEAPIDHSKYTRVSAGMTGTVKMYSPDKKYGFISVPGHEDVFVHADNRITSIMSNEEVTFDLVRGTDGRVFAVGVRSHAPLAKEIPGAAEHFAARSETKRP